MPLSPYLKRIRSQVGSDLVFLPAVTILIEDEAGRLLLVRHSDSGQWGTVGGAVEPFEAPADAAVRETLEETVTRVRIDRLVAP